MTSARQPCEQAGDHSGAEHGQHRDDRAETLALQPHHRTPVEVIAALAPRTIGWLSVPLTPARRARLDVLALNGIDPVQLILDFLDDEIFSTPAPCIASPAAASTRADISSASPSANMDEQSIGGT